MLTEARFAVGSRAGPRSTIWKAWVQRDEAYLSSRMFGSDVKVSFHSSGQCQWSCTDTWVAKQPLARNADRHMVRWIVEPPIGSAAVLLFSVEIPISELREEAPPNDSKKVFWVSGAPAESSVRFLLYLTRTNDLDPGHSHQGVQRHLFSLRLNNGRWVVVFVEPSPLTSTDVSEARRLLFAKALDAGIEPNPVHRASAFIQPGSPGGAYGILELCLTEP